MRTESHPKSDCDRRTAMKMAAAAVAAGSVAVSNRAAIAAPSDAPDDSFRVKNGRAKQSVMAWCFNPMPMETLIPACAKMGMTGMEGIDSKHYPMMKENGLAVSLTGSHGFKDGPVDPENHAMCAEKIRKGIDLAVKWDCKSVITFTGMRTNGINDEQGSKNCVKLWKSVAGYAEQKGVAIVLEHLNSRDDTHPMKGHPGYFGDDVEHCIDLIKSVASPNMKLLFDVYHVGVMNGDVIRRFRQYKDLIGHVHTAGVPGRGELDDTQELNYPAIIRAILDTGYDGYITQEFIPTWDDKLASLRHGVMVCDV